MKYGDEIAGHFVQGHVDTTIKVLNINSDNPKSWNIFLIFQRNLKNF